MAADTVNKMIYSSNSNNCEYVIIKCASVCNAAISAKLYMSVARTRYWILLAWPIPDGVCWAHVVTRPKRHIPATTAPTHATQWVLISLPAVAEPVVVLGETAMAIYTAIPIGVLLAMA